MAHCRATPASPASKADSSSVKRIRHRAARDAASPQIGAMMLVSGVRCQKGLDRGYETRWVVGVQPVAGILQGDEARIGKQGSDHRAVFGADVIGCGTGNEQ